MRSAKPRAFSLVETLVACALLALLFGLFFNVLTPTLRASARATARVELQQLALVAADMLVRDLGQTQAAGLSLSTSPTRVLLGAHSLDEITADGQQTWKDHAVVYDWQPGTLRRLEWPPGPPSLSWTLQKSTPAQFSPVELAQVADGGQQFRIVARQIDLLEVQEGSAEPGITAPLHLRMLFGKSVYGSDNHQKYEWKRDLILRN